MKSIKNIRIGNYDYSQNGYYFVTVCSHLNQPFLKTNRSSIEYAINETGNYEGVTIDYYVIMDNHIHSIIILENCALKLGEIVRRLKALASKKAGTQLWQPNYYEHVIRNEDALQRIRTYIENNPVVEKLKFEEFYEK